MEQSAPISSPPSLVSYHVSEQCCFTKLGPVVPPSFPASTTKSREGCHGSAGRWSFRRFQDAHVQRDRPVSHVCVLGQCVILSFAHFCIPPLLMSPLSLSTASTCRDENPVDAVMGCRAPLTDFRHLDGHSAHHRIWRHGTEICETGLTAAIPLRWFRSDVHLRRYTHIVSGQIESSM